MIRNNGMRHIPEFVLFTAVFFVLTDMHLQEPGHLRGVDFLIVLFLSSLLIQFGLSGLGIALGILVYLMAFQYNLQFSSCQSLPFQEKHIHVIRGELIEDPSWIRVGTVRLQMNCSSAATADGCEAPADCDITVFLDASHLPSDPFTVSRGARVSISGSFSSGLKPQEDYWFRGSDFSFSYDRGRHFLRMKLLRSLRQKCGQIGDATEVLLPALVFGMNHPGKSRFSDLFRESGTAHIMALSGFHAGLVGLLLFLTGRVFLGRRGGYLFSMAGLVFFLWLVGFRPSLVRAVGMYWLFAMAKLTHRSFSGLSVLLFSYFLYGIIDPSSIDSLSSQLSYLALGGIMTSGVRLNTLLEGSLPQWFRFPLCASLSAQLWTTGLVLLAFGASYPIGLIASLVLTPLITVYLYAGILWLLLPPLPFVSGIFQFWLGLLEKTLWRAGEFFGGFPPIQRIIEGPGPFLLFLIPVLLLEFYQPGRFHGQRKAGFEL